MTLREEAGAIIEYAISKVQPRIAVERALENLGEVQGRLIVIAIGKAAWQMGKAAADLLGNKITQGIVITKYGNSRGPIPGLEIFEAGHPIPDKNSFDATRKAVRLTEGLTDKDLVLMLISGGGSALFEIPLCAEESLIDITRQLLCCGAEVGEINTVRKRLSAVKGGRFAKLCEPASVYSVIMSDLLGDPLDMIASGPTVPDKGTCDMAEEVVKKYNLFLPEDIQQLLKKETPKVCENERAVVTGSVRELCAAAAWKCEQLGYKTQILATENCCLAREAGTLLASIAREYQHSKNSMAFIIGGETAVMLTGNGIGGRNQELALAAARGISGLKNTAVFSVGSDGTDGPTDAAGGYADGDTYGRLRAEGYSVSSSLLQNDSYRTLKAVDGLIITGSTGTNVNDFACVLIKR